MVCDRCGAPLREGELFCPQCGASVSGGAQGQPAAQKSANVCKICGAPLREGDLFCPQCGASVSGGAQGQPVPQGSAGNAPPRPQGAGPSPAQADAPSGGFFTLGFFFPIVGLILFLVWREQLPLRARSCGKGALIGAIVEVALGVVIGVLGGIAMLHSMGILSGLLSAGSAV